MDPRITSNLISITDPDTPLYRIFRLEHLRGVLRDNAMALVPPSKWEDPTENPLISFAITHANQSGRQEFLDNTRRSMFAQCWSFRQGSDTMWRSYSRVRKDRITQKNLAIEDEGVMVQTTAGRLLRALWAASPTDPADTCFLGRVHYKPENQFWQDFTDEIGRRGLQAFSDGQGHAESLLIKRNAFEDEREARLIYVEDNRSPAARSRFIVPVEPNDLFDAIIVDPRLNTNEVNERRQDFEGLGFANGITKSSLYQRKLIEVQVG